MNNSSSLTAFIPTCSGPVSSLVTIPGSKSIANRALILAGVATGKSHLTAVPESNDIRAALGALQSLGRDITSPGAGDYRITGDGLHFPAGGDIPIGSSGTVGRFLPGILAAGQSGPYRLQASGQLARRPLAPLLQALREWQAGIDTAPGGLSFPLTIHGGGLTGGEIHISAAQSSQFASGLLLAAPLCRREAVIHIDDVDPEECYLDITLELMRRFGVESSAERCDTTLSVTVPAPQMYRPVTMAVEADFNSAMYFLCLPLLVGGRIAVANLRSDSLQPGRKFLTVLERLGGCVTAGPDGIALEADGSRLHGGFSIDMRAMSEMALTLGILAVFSDGPITMTNLAHIRGHETDRLSAMATLLDSCGVRCDEGPDWIRVHPAERSKLRHAAIDSLDDHRLVMSFSLLGLGGGGITITNAQAAAKTFPEFFATLKQTGIPLRVNTGT